MLQRFLAVLTIVGFMVPSIVCAEFAPQFKESSKGTADLSKSAPTHGQVYKSNTSMGKNTHQKNISKNNQVMESNAANQKQSHKIIQGTVNE